jgi:hypothetical protein
MAVSLTFFRPSLYLVPAVFFALTALAQTPSLKPGASLASCGPLKGQTLRCPSFGFTYKVPFGWVDRTEDMQDTALPDPQAGSTPEQKQPPAVAPDSGTKTLLAVFERPPGAPGEAVNSAVIIAAEPVSAYPKLKSAADYFGPLDEIAEQRGLKMDGAPYLFAVGVKQLARGDFGSSGQPPIRQTSLVTIEKGYVLSFTFLSGSDDEINDLIYALSFRARPTHSSHHP